MKPRSLRIIVNQESSTTIEKRRNYIFSIFLKLRMLTLLFFAFYSSTLGFSIVRLFGYPDDPADSSMNITIVPCNNDETCVTAFYQEIEMGIRPLCSTGAFCNIRGERTCGHRGGQPCCAYEVAPGNTICGDYCGSGICDGGNVTCVAIDFEPLGALCAINSTSCGQCDGHGTCLPNRSPCPTRPPRPTTRPPTQPRPTTRPPTHPPTERTDAPTEHECDDYVDEEEEQQGEI